jgi:hypothetical protein
LITQGIEKLQEVQEKAKLRGIFVFIIIHIGLALGIYALATNAAEGWSATSTLFLSALLCLYLGFVLGIFFIVWPLLPWLKRIRQAETWVERILRELPVFLEHLPKIIAAIQALRANVQPVPPTQTSPVEQPTKTET